MANMTQMMLTKAIRNKLPKLYATEQIPALEKRIIVKFFSPWTSWTWYAVEGEEKDGDFTFFGLVAGNENEWGYFSLNELTEVRGPGGLRIERDYHFGMPTVAELFQRHPNLR